MPEKTCVPQPVRPDDPVAGSLDEKAADYAEISPRLPLEENRARLVHLTRQRCPNCGERLFFDGGLSRGMLRCANEQSCSHAWGNALVAEEEILYGFPKR